LHHHLALPLSEGVRKLRLVVFGDDVVEIWLTTKLVYPLGDLVAGSITKTRE
jgi:hypothetical protein